MKNVLNGVALSFVVFLFAYSVLGIFGGPTEGPMFVWSAWWYPHQIFPGTSRAFEDHLLNALLFGGLCAIWAWRTARRRSNAVSGE